MNGMTMNTKWDMRWLTMAQFVSHWSKDPSSQVGAVIANGKDHISHGYNGFPEHIEDKPEWYNDRQKKYSLIDHAEKNAIRRANSSHTRGATMYTYPFPMCSKCVELMIAETHISRVVSIGMWPDRWEEDIQKGFSILRNNHIEIDVSYRIQTSPFGQFLITR